MPGRINALFNILAYSSFASVNDEVTGEKLWMRLFVSRQQRLRGEMNVAVLLTCDAKMFKISK